jgi:hypothetical protein
MAKEAGATAPKAAEVKNISVAQAAPKTEEAKKAGRIVIKFIGDDKKPYSSPPAKCLGLVAVHNPEGGLATKQYAHTRKDALQGKDDSGIPDFIWQNYFFGASVHLRNQINTEKDENQARANFEARLTGFNSGIYRAASEGTESVPLVMQALRLALVASGGFTDDIIEEKVARQMKVWTDADKAGKQSLRDKLLSNPEVKKAFMELSVKNVKAVEEKVDLAAL